MTPHVPEEILQQLALNGQTSDSVLHAHLTQCAHCQAIITQYQQLFAALPQLPLPPAEPQLYAQVLAQLPLEKPASAIHPLVFLGLIGLTLGVPGTLLWPTLEALWSYLLIPFAYLSVPVALLLLFGLSLEAVRHHQRQMRQLRFSLADLQPFAGRPVSCS